MVTPVPAHAPSTCAALLVDWATTVPLTASAFVTEIMEPPPMVNTAPACTVIALYVTVVPAGMERSW